MFSWSNKLICQYIAVQATVTLLSDEGNWSEFLSPGGFFHSSIIQQKLITSFVPFLPLSRHHVERCVRSQLCQRGSCARSDVVEAVGGDMIYTPSSGKYFSSTGCKAVPAKINLFLWVEGLGSCLMIYDWKGNSLWRESVKKERSPRLSHLEQHLEQAEIQSWRGLLRSQLPEFKVVLCHRCLWRYLYRSSRYMSNCEHRRVYSLSFTQCLNQPRSTSNPPLPFNLWTLKLVQCGFRFQLQLIYHQCGPSITLL